MEPEWKDIPSELIDLIAECLLGTAGEEQQEKLAEWLAADESHRLFYEKMESSAMAEGLARRRSFDSARALVRVNSRLNRRKGRKWRRVLPYAASVLLAVGLGLYLFNDNGGRLYIEPHQPNAILTVSTGETVELDRNKAVIADSISGFRNEGDVLSYMETTKPEQTAIHSLYVPKGSRHRLILPDGTQVWLNSDTRLKFYDNFIGGTREVELAGEAYFDVVRNDEAPFIVKTGGMDIRVLGTEFNISAYEDEETIAATLVSGSIEAVFEDAATIKVAPGHRVTYGRNDGLTGYAEVSPFIYSAWKDDKVMFYHTRMSDVAEQLSRWYDVEFRFADESLRDVTIFAVLNRYDDVGQLLEAISNDAVGFRVKNRVITVIKP